jgi:predicted Fe-Mo cluster-binding NifX family protein
MNKIAIPINEGMLSENFEKCKHFEIFSIYEKHINSNIIEVPYAKLESEISLWLKGLGITDVVSYKIDKQTIKAFQAHKINLFIGIRRTKPHEIIKDFIEGKLYPNEAIILEITKE